MHTALLRFCFHAVFINIGLQSFCESLGAYLELLTFSLPSFDPLRHSVPLKHFYNTRSILCPLMRKNVIFYLTFFLFFVRSKFSNFKMILRMLRFVTIRFSVVVLISFDNKLYIDFNFI